LSVFECKFFIVLYCIVLYCIAFKMTAKPLQIETCLLLTAYRNSSSPYPKIPSSTLYDVRFSHNICVTNDKQQTDETSWPKIDLTVNQTYLWSSKRTGIHRLLLG